jgi:hypothetical protein
MSGTPTWRRVFDAAEQRISGPLTRTTNAREFAHAMSVAQRVNRGVNRLTVGVFSWTLHRWQVPAYEDVRRLGRQLNRVERRLRELSHQIDELAEREREEEDADRHPG